MFDLEYYIQNHLIYNTIVNFPNYMGYMLKTYRKNPHILVSQSLFFLYIHLCPLPGTDGALALGMARVIITENLQNQVYIDQYTEGFEEFKEYVMQFTPEKVEELTGVPKEDMVAAARMMAENAPFPIMTWKRSRRISAD